jgi:hypothetical protein
MALVASANRLYCTVTDSSFGPECTSDDEAEQLAAHVWRTRGRDARAVDGAELVVALGELRSGWAEWLPTHIAVRCYYCGSGRPYLTKAERLNKPNITTCEHCTGTFAPIANQVVAPAVLH